MNIRCFIIDNEEHALDVIRKFIINTPGLELAGAETNPLLALNKVTGGDIVADITFLDIDMPQLSGIELAELIGTYTRIIFTTAFSEYAVKAFDKDALDYLLKPVSYERFLKAINKAKEKLNPERAVSKVKEKDHFFIQSEGKGKLIRISYVDIVYIESAQNYIRIHLADAAYLTYLTMKEIEETLPADRFMRVHKSFIINLAKISSVESGIIHLTDGSAVTLAQSYRKEMLDMISPTLVRSKRL
ncbi:MAG: response regulator transcription factor [Chitinophagaceae bacterium]|nr:response regulator transcription factor [Chitinophagaceae bacterium]